LHTHHVAYTLCLMLQILHADTCQVCAVNDTGFVCDGSKSTFRVLFKEPVEIQANTSYIACATLKVIAASHLCTVQYCSVLLTCLEYCALFFVHYSYRFICPTSLLLVSSKLLDPWEDDDIVHI